MQVDKKLADLLQLLVLASELKDSTKVKEISEAIQDYFNMMRIKSRVKKRGN